MWPHNSLTLFIDILAAADFMQARAQVITREDYLANEDLKVIFERKFEVIGEALSRLRKTDPASFSQIRHTAAAVDFRNVLIHGYGSIDHTIVWDTYSHWLPELVADTRQLHAQSPDNAP